MKIDWVRIRTQYVYLRIPFLHNAIPPILIRDYLHYSKNAHMYSTTGIHK